MPAIRPDERVLRQVHREIRIPGEPVGDRVHDVLVALDQIVEGLAVACLGWPAPSRGRSLWGLAPWSLAHRLGIGCPRRVVSRRSRPRPYVDSRCCISPNSRSLSVTSLLDLGQTLLRARLEAHHDDRLRVRGSHEAPAVAEEDPDAVHVDDVVVRLEVLDGLLRLSRTSSRRPRSLPGSREWSSTSGSVATISESGSSLRESICRIRQEA